MRRTATIIAWCAVVLGSIVLAVCVALIVSDEPRPRGRSGADAEDLSRRLEQAVALDAWERTGAVRWTFAGEHEHLWDRERDVARVRWDDVEVLVHEGSASGRAYRGGVEVEGEDARSLLERGNAAWINDSFWLNPIAKLRDEGVTRSDIDGALLVEYSSGGLTPGDAYLWFLGDDGAPVRFRLWVSILPIGGVEATWEGWVDLATGARISTRHRGPLGLVLELTDVEGAATLAELEPGPDPFAPLFED